jgi:hypothetical protein
MHELVPGLKFDAEVPCELAGVEAVRQKYTASRDGKEFVVTSTVAIRGEMLYVINCTASRDEFPDCAATFEAMVGSFRFIDGSGK